MGEGTKQVTLPPPGKFLEEINYQEIVEGEVRNLSMNILNVFKYFLKVVIIF